LTWAYSGSGNLVEETVWLGGIPVATLRAHSGGGVDTYYIHSDHLNTARKITRPSDNALVWRIDQDPFGTAVPNQNPAGYGTFVYNLGFPGQIYMAETSLNYNYERDYDPALGRYIESDPIGLAGGSFSTYAYAGGNSANRFDSRGLSNWNFFDPTADPVLYQLAQQWNPNDVYSVAGHGAEYGNGQSAGVMELPDGSLITPAQLAQMIRNDRNWKGKPVEIRGCSVGQGRNSFAQQLANLLGTNVTAGTGAEELNALRIPFSQSLIDLGIGFPLGGQGMVFTPQRTGL
jgi:RHS repeat-associated protein